MACTHSFKVAASTVSVVSFQENELLLKDIAASSPVIDLKMVDFVRNRHNNIVSQYFFLNLSPLFDLRLKKSQNFL